MSVFAKPDGGMTDGCMYVYVYERKCFISISEQHLRGTNLFLKMVKDKRF